jgi:hypothetical protein
MAEKISLAACHTWSRSSKTHDLSEYDEASRNWASCHHLLLRWSALLSSERKFAALILVTYLSISEAG